MYVPAQAPTGSLHHLLHDLFFVESDDKLTRQVTPFFGLYRQFVRDLEYRHACMHQVSFSFVGGTAKMETTQRRRRDMGGGGIETGLEGKRGIGGVHHRLLGYDSTR